MSLKLKYMSLPKNITNMTKSAIALFDEFNFIEYWNSAINNEIFLFS